MYCMCMWERRACSRWWGVGGHEPEAACEGWGRGALSRGSARQQGSIATDHHDRIDDRDRLTIYPDRERVEGG